MNNSIRMEVKGDFYFDVNWYDIECSLRDNKSVDTEGWICPFYHKYFDIWSHYNPPSFWDEDVKHGIKTRKNKKPLTWIVEGWVLRTFFVRNDGDTNPLWRQRTPEELPTIYDPRIIVTKYEKEMS